MPNDNEKIKQLTDEKPIKLEQMQGWPAGHYKLSPAHVGAIQAAYFCQRPLLVRGGPGLGKSQLAQAIASLLGWGLITSVVHYNTSVDDLLYSIDHVKRLDEANSGDDKVKSIDKYLQPDKLWQAIAPSTLSEYDLEQPHNKSGSVLLIDEIDKAESSLPNALLEVLANGAISTPYLKEAIKADETHPCFVVITSNEERLLPQAFLRRCAVLDIQLPTDREEATEWMLEIFKTHYPDEQTQTELLTLATQVADNVIDQRQRVEAQNNGDYKVGTSEFLDMLKVLKAFDADERSAKLALLGTHLMNKTQLRQDDV
ncbi:MAG: MoxR-like ATPase [Alteromonadaceae bacterium]|jgi:MoxR-like ATPase